MPETVTIPGRFNGPPASANGGYAAGVAGALVGGTATATLRLPPPLDRPLAIHREGEAVELRDGNAVVIHAEPGSLDDLEVPAPVDPDTAADAATRYPGFEEHLFDRCFVCGPQRLERDGLRIFPGPVAGRDDGVFAAPWTPDDTVTRDDGTVPEAIVWAALDCPSGFAVLRGELAVLGRLTARLEGPIRTGAPHVAMGWSLGRDGRKLHSASAIVDADGAVLALARATWIVLRSDDAAGA